MTLKKQIETIKENWLLVSLAFLFILILVSVQFSTSSFQRVNQPFNSALSYSAKSLPSTESSFMRGSTSDFSPETTQRKITKTASITNEVENNKFFESEKKLKSIVKSSDSFLLNENVNKYGKDKKEYHVGTYQIKVSTDKYDSTINLLKEIGKVNYFKENSQDITGQYVNNKKQLEIEKEKLLRYQSKLNETKDVSEWIDLSDRIASLEYRIKYYEDLISKQDLQVEYSTIDVTIQEKQSTFANIVFMKWSDLIGNLVNNINSIAGLLFSLTPWIITIWLIKILWNFKSKKKISKK